MVECPERTTQHGVGYCALHDRDRVDVDEGVAEADDHEACERDRRRIEHGDQREWQAEEHDAEAEVRREAVPGGQHECHEAAYQSAHSDCGVQVADPTFTHPEQVEGNDDDENLERACHKGLGGVDAGEKAEVGREPAVREENACSPLLKNAAVPALAMALARFDCAGAALRLQTPSTQPSRSVTAMTALVLSGDLSSLKRVSR